MSAQVIRFPIERCRPAESAAAPAAAPAAAVAAAVAVAPKAPLPSLERDEAIARIKAALKKRSGKPWSVTGGRGTSWSWIRISAPPKRLTEFGSLTPADQAELSQLLGKQVHHQGESIAASSAYRWEYVDRAEGNPPRVTGEPYWD